MKKIKNSLENLAATFLGIVFIVTVFKIIALYVDLAIIFAIEIFLILVVRMFFSNKKGIKNHVR